MIQEIAIKNLLPNPFRKIETYPIVKQVVEELKKSMEETGVWVGIVARKANLNGKYEIAFGHHRLAAMRELDVKAAPVDVQEIDDLRMVQQMAFENMSARKTNTSVILETVSAAREQLTIALEGWDWSLGAESRGLKRLFENKTGFQTWKGQRTGIGRGILLHFLGTHWEANIKRALELIMKAEEGRLNLKAAEKFDSPSQAKAFAEVVEEKNVAVGKQEEFADQVIGKIQRIWGDEEESDSTDQSELTVSRIKQVGSHGDSKEISERWLDNKRWELNEAVDRYARDLECINNGLPDILENWGMVTDASQRRFILAAMNFTEILQERVKTWKKNKEIQC